MNKKEICLTYFVEHAFVAKYHRLDMVLDRVEVLFRAFDSYFEFVDADEVTLTELTCDEYALKVEKFAVLPDKRGDMLIDKTDTRYCIHNVQIKSENLNIKVDVTCFQEVYPGQDLNKYFPMMLEVETVMAAYTETFGFFNSESYLFEHLGLYCKVMTNQDESNLNLLSKEEFCQELSEYQEEPEDAEDCHIVKKIGKVNLEVIVECDEVLPVMFYAKDCAYRKENQALSIEKHLDVAYVIGVPPKKAEMIDTYKKIVFLEETYMVLFREDNRCFCYYADGNTSALAELSEVEYIYLIYTHKFDRINNYDLKV